MTLVSSLSMPLVDTQKAALYSVMALWGACMEGYNLTIPGNIVSNQGFINQFGESVISLPAGDAR